MRRLVIGACLLLLAVIAGRFFMGSTTTAPVVPAPLPAGAAAGPRPVSPQPLGEEDTLRQSASLAAQQQPAAADARSRILAAVSALDAADSGRVYLLSELSDLVRADPSLPGFILQQLRARQLKDRTRAALYVVLQLADTEAAQSALVSVLTDTSWSLKDSQRAVMALGGIRHPTPETVAALWDAVGGAPQGGERQLIGIDATLALGSIGNTMRQADNPDYYALRQRLLIGAASGDATGYSVRQRTLYLLALGNTRDPALTADVTPLLDDGAAQVRRAAAAVLGSLDTDAAADQLLSHLRSEQNSAVRAAIVGALVQWGTPTAAAMTSMRTDILAEPNEETRFNMARLLTGNLQQFPENRAALLDLLPTEQSQRIRRMVAAALAKNPGR